MHGTNTEQDDEVVVDNRRSAIEAALEAIEPNVPETVAPATASATVEAAPPKAETAPTASPPTVAGATPPDDPAKSPTAPGGEQLPVDRAPQSWRPASKAKWSAVDPELQQEIVKREREITRTLGETAEARQFHGRFNEVLTPYKARIEAVKLDPLQVFSELMQSDHILSTAEPVSKAEYLADLIQYYKVDVVELDKALAALAGTPAAPAQNSNQLREIIAQELAPIKSHYTKVAEEENRKNQEAAEHQTEENRATIAAMAADTVKYPHFDHLRDEMADIVEYSAKKGIYLTLDQAYTRAIALNPELSPPVTAKTSVASNNSAQLANARAQKALKASKSVGGAPRVATNSSVDVTDRKATISAAFDEIDGR